MPAFQPETMIAIALGTLLDAAFGDPVRMPHIVRAVGRLTARGETILVALAGRTIWAGALLWLGVAGICLGGYLLLAAALARIHPWAPALLDALVVFQCLAYTDLVKHVRAVREALRSDLRTARERVSWIVGRDTDRMEEADVCRAAIESGAENLNDAVVAPLLWATLLGPLGAILYRVSNTMDAIVGHRSPRFEKLGKVSARIDDVLNFLPARLCSTLILPLRDACRWRDLKSDAILHPSVNAGWPEAAMAKRLGVVIGGRMYQGGVLAQTAEMNPGGRQPGAADIDRATRFMRGAYLKALALSLLVWAFVCLIDALMPPA